VFVDVVTRRVSPTLTRVCPPGLKARRSKTLQDLAHWTRDHIVDAELAANQLPRRVQTRRKPADKPLHW